MDGNADRPVDLHRVPVALLAEILAKVGRRRITTEAIKEDLRDGAPRNPDGTIDLVQYTAWLCKEDKRG